MPSVLLVGTPNSGKTALFNRLTGLNQRVANYPGITVDLSVGGFARIPELDLVDFPGTYSLRPISEEERVAVAHFDHSLADPEVAHVVCVVDATRLEKSLLFCLQVIRACQRQRRAVTVVATAGAADVVAAAALPPLLLPSRRANRIRMASLSCARIAL